MNVLDSFSLKNKVAIVTGGYGNLGTAFSEALLEAGAIVIVTGHNKDKFDSKFENKDNIYYYEMDISKTQDIISCFEYVNQTYNRIDILINNAVYLKGQFPELITDEDLNYSLEGVLGSVFRAIREVIPYMKKAGMGNIINIASMYGVVVPDFRLYDGECKDSFNPPQYGAAKAGVIQLTKYFAEYLIPFNIRVNAISPGTFPSIATQENKEFIRRLSSKNPANRIGIPDDLKGTLVYLASDASTYVVGQNIQVDGGWTLW